MGLLTLASCNLFLEKPDTTGVYDEETMFSSKKYAHTTLMDCYRNVLRHGLGGGWGVSHGVFSNISGERSKGYSWHGTFMIAESGLDANPVGNETVNGADNYAQGWVQIRRCYKIIENVDNVPDMSDSEKEMYKAEALGLIAYRYMGMFYRYGGVPIVKSSYNAEDDLSEGRVSLQETYDFIMELCDEAYAVLPAGDRAPDEKGRLTRGVILAIKARVDMFAARPLFNRATPYMSLGENNKLICFGSKNQSRWDRAIKSNEDLLSWAHGNGYKLIKSSGEGAENTFEEAVKDYGTATSGMSNQEAILQYKVNDWDYNVFKYICTTPNMGNHTGERWDLDQSGLLSNSLEKYYTRDGENQSWPVIGDQARAGADWVERINNMEARLLVDNLFAGVEDHVGNPGNTTYQASRQGKPLINSGTHNAYPDVYAIGHGPRATKFYYNAGGKVWSELPLFRLAETHLNLAEAYNEVGNVGKALDNLNAVHLRAGLPAITTTDQGELRELIQRERALELYGENHRYFDAKHWMIADIADGGLCGPMREFQYYTESDHNNFGDKIISYWDAVTYNAFWANYMYLEPFPQEDVNNKAAIQNPGY